MKQSPTQREKIIRDKLIAHLTQLGWCAWYPPHVMRYQRDIFGVFDIAAARGNKVIFIQLTTVSNISKRIRKVRAFYENNKLKLNCGYVYAYNAIKDAWRVVRVLR